MKDTTTPENALLIPSQDVVAQAFGSDDALEALISAIEKECRAEHYTVATREGRERIKSQAYKISRSKTAMDDVGKGLTEEARKLVTTINTRRGTATSRFDALREEIRKPLTDWEDADKARQKVIKDRIETLFGTRQLPASSADMRAIQDATVQIELDDTFGEFLQDAAKAKDNFLRFIAGKIQEAVLREENEAELARLRKEAADRKAADEADARARADAEVARLAEEAKTREAIKAAEDEKNAALAAKDSELEAMRAQLAAMKEQPLPAPVGIVEPAPETAVMQEPIALVGDHYTVVAVIAPVSIERQISTAIIAIIKQCHTHEAMADELASAIFGGEIPHVQVVA